MYNEQRTKDNVQRTKDNVMNGNNLENPSNPLYK